jgi:putative ABC transport system substrate-binding protein
LPALAKELASRPVNVIVAAGGAEVALAAKSATSTIPVVFEMGGDPIALGVVDSLSRPGGNLTGVSSLSVEVSRKRLEFLHEVRPDSKLFAFALNPTSPTSNSQLKNLETAATSLGLELAVLKASDEQKFEALFGAARDMKAGGLVFASDPYFAFRSQQLAGLAVHHAVAAMTQSRDFPIAGGLMSYGGDFSQSHRQAGVYAGRVLKGEKPSDLPVQRITKVELFINLKAAGALGISFPPWVLSSADAVIE